MTFLSLVRDHGQKTAGALVALGLLVAKYGFGLVMEDSDVAIAWLSVLGLVTAAQSRLKRPAGLQGPR